MSQNETSSRSWFVVLNNPKKNSSVLNTLESNAHICQEIVFQWQNGGQDRSSACLYCKSAEGLEHCHIVLETKNGAKFSAIKNFFEKWFDCSPHIELTKGNKSQVEDYVNKRGKFEEKGEVILEKFQQGELIGAQGRRTDLTLLAEEIANGKTPAQILAENPEAYKFKNHLNDMFNQKRKKEVGILREVHFNWECGPSGSGKSYIYVELCDKYGPENVYYVNCESGHLFDNYNGEPYVVLDEFRGGVIKWGELLSLTDKYVTPVAARYMNKLSLWSHIFVVVVNPPDITYSEVLFNKGLDNFTQLIRRLESVSYHFKEGEEFKEIRVSPKEYFEHITELKKSCESISLESSSTQKNAFLLPDRKAFFEKCSSVVRSF